MSTLLPMASSTSSIGSSRVSLVIPTHQSGRSKLKKVQVLIQSRLDPLLHARVVDAAKAKRMTLARYVREALLCADREARDQAQAERFAEVIAAQSEAIGALAQAVEKLHQKSRRT